jgi:hypothetical protein
MMLELYENRHHHDRRQTENYCDMKGMQHGEY